MVIRIDDIPENDDKLTKTPEDIPTISSFLAAQGSFVDPALTEGELINVDEAIAAGTPIQRLPEQTQDTIAIAQAARSSAEEASRIAQEKKLEAARERSRAEAEAEKEALVRQRQIEDVVQPTIVEERAAARRRRTLRIESADKKVRKAFEDAESALDFERTAGRLYDSTLALDPDLPGSFLNPIRQIEERLGITSKQRSKNLAAFNTNKAVHVDAATALAKKRNGARVTDADVEQAIKVIGDPNTKSFRSLATLDAYNFITTARERVWNEMRADLLIEKPNATEKEIENNFESWKTSKDRTVEDVGSVAWGNAQLNRIDEKLGEPGTRFRRPSQEAIDLLQNNPSLAPQFNEHFGPGTADKFLKSE